MSKDGHNVIDAKRTKIDRKEREGERGRRSEIGDRDTKKSFRVLVTASFLLFSRYIHDDDDGDGDDIARRRIKKEGGTRARLGENAISRPGPNVAPRQTFISGGADCPD